MGRYVVSWRAWAVLVCLQVAAVCVDAAGLHQSAGVARQQVQDAPGRFLDSLFEDEDSDGGDNEVMGRFLLTLTYLQFTANLSFS